MPQEFIVRCAHKDHTGRDLNVSVIAENSNEAVIKANNFIEQSTKKSIKYYVNNSEVQTRQAWNYSYASWGEKPTVVEIGEIMEPTLDNSTFKRHFKNLILD